MEEAVGLANEALGHLYAEGEDVLEDSSRAITYLVRAAEMGRPGASLKLAHMYALGEGIPHDTDKSIYYLNSAGEQMGDNYVRGLDVITLSTSPQEGGDRFLALEADLREIARREVPQQMSRIAIALVDQAMSKEQLDEAIEWLLIAAEMGGGEAKNELGVLHYRGHGVEQNFAKAAEYFRQAVFAPYVVDPAYINYATVLEKGQGVAQDQDLANWVLRLGAYKYRSYLAVRALQDSDFRGVFEHARAVALVKEAQAARHRDALSMIANRRFREEKLQDDSAWDDLQALVRDEHPPTMVDFARIILRRNTWAALGMLERANQLGDPTAATFLGILTTGDGSDRERFAEGVRHLDVAVDRGDPDAHYWFAHEVFTYPGQEHLRNEALGHLETAANFHYPAAMTYLATLHLEGNHGIAQDTARARDLLHRAAEQEFPHAHYHLAKMILNEAGERVLNEKEKAAVIEHYRFAAIRGHINATLALGEWACNGIHQAREHWRACFWLDKIAAPSGRPEFVQAWYLIARMSELDGDYESAHSLYEQSAKEGHAASQAGLGRLSADGHGTRRSSRTAKKMFKKAW